MFKNFEYVLSIKQIYYVRSKLSSEDISLFRLSNKQIELEITFYNANIMLYL